MEEMTLRDAIRKRPALYVGSLAFAGFSNLLNDFAGSHLPRFPNEFTEAKTIFLKITGNRSGLISISDLDLEPRSSEQSWGPDIWLFRGFGSLGPLTKSCELRLFDQNDHPLLAQSYRYGLLTDGGLPGSELLPSRMELEFTLDDTLVKTMDLHPHAIAEVLKELAFLFPQKRFVLEFDVDGETCHVVFQFPNGMLDLVEINNKMSLVEGDSLTTVNREFKDFSLETSFVFNAGSIIAPFFRSYVNHQYSCDGGSHVRGVTLGIERALKKFVRKNDPEDRFLITHRTILRSIIGAVHVRMKAVRFAGSVKNRLMNDEIVPPISNAVFEALGEKFESFPDQAIQVRKAFFRDRWFGKFRSSLGIETASNGPFKSSFP